jgi:hypothetical protein
MKEIGKCFFQAEYTSPALTGAEFRIIGCQWGVLYPLATKTCQVFKTWQALPARFKES